MLGFKILIPSVRWSASDSTVVFIHSNEIPDKLFNFLTVLSITEKHILKKSLDLMELSTKKP